MTSLLSKQRQVFDWLHRLELPHHFERFIDNGYDDLDICVEIRDSDLSAIGIIDLHERIALLQAVRDLKHQLHQRSPNVTPNSNHHHHNPHQLSVQSQQILGGKQGKGKGKSYPNLPTNPEFHHQLLRHHQNNSSWNVQADQHQEFLSVYHLHQNSNHLNHNNQQNNNLLDNNNYSVVCGESDGEYHEETGQGAQYFLVGGGTNGCKNSVNGISAADVSRSRDNFDNGCDSEPFYESLSPHHEPSLATVSVIGVVGSANNHKPKSGGRNHSGANLILRTQLRDQVIQDGINISRIPDEMTLRAVAAQYASELSFSSSGSCTSGSNSGSSSNGNNRGESSRNSTSNSNSMCNSNSSPSTQTTTQAPSWITQGLPLLDFQEAVLDQLREIWLEERSKLFPSCNSGSTITMSSSYGAPRDSNAFETSTTTLGRGFTNLSPSTANSGKCRSLMTSGRHGPGPPPHHYPKTIAPDGFRFPSTASPHHSNNANANTNSNNAKGSPTLIIPSNINASNPSSASPEHQFQAQAQSTPRHGQRHQYLQHVIISNSPSEPEQTKPVYTPGIYLPSSCLRDKDDIYDYAPPVQRAPYHSPSKRSGSTLTQTTKQQSKGKANKLKDKNYGPGLASSFKGPSATQTSPKRTHNLSTIRLRGSTMSSYAISPGCCSAPVPNGSSASAYGFAHYGHTGTLPSGGKGSSGCRTLANLSKLSRRLGLARFFRTLRLHHSNGSASNGSSHQNSGNHRKHYFTPVDSSTTPSSTIATVSEMEHQQRQQNIMHKNPSLFMSASSSTSCSTPGLSRLQRVPNSNENPKTPSHSTQSQYGRSSLSSLPSNERIIETINRLKYEELQRRKERIAQEHQMMLKELKESMSANTSGSEGPSSIFYVSSNSNGTTSDYMYEGGSGDADVDEEDRRNENVIVVDGEGGEKEILSQSVKINQHTYDEPPYETVQVLSAPGSSSSADSTKSYNNNNSHTQLLQSQLHSSEKEKSLQIIPRESDCDCEEVFGKGSSSTSSSSCCATAGPVVPQSENAHQLSRFREGLSCSEEGVSEPRGNKSESATPIFTSASRKSLPISTSQDPLEKPSFHIGKNRKGSSALPLKEDDSQKQQLLPPLPFLSYTTSNENPNDLHDLGHTENSQPVLRRQEKSGNDSTASRNGHKKKRNSVGNLWQLFSGSSSTVAEFDSDTYTTTGRSQRSSGVSSGRTSSSSESFSEMFARNLKIKNNKEP